MKNIYFTLIASLFLIGCKSGNTKAENAIPDSPAVVGTTPNIVSQPVIDTATKFFKGAWFDIRYPANFVVKPSLISKANNKEGYESVFFTSPDGDVIFYVFSPWWSGKATDISLKAGEKLISKDSADDGLQRTVKSWTIEANDKSYLRSYQEIIMDDHINMVFGIQYKDEAAYNKYKVQYIAFKESLNRYIE